MKQKARISNVILILFLTALTSCTTIPSPDTSGASLARIKKFTISQLENDFAVLEPILCEVVEGTDSGVIRGYLPGGTSREIKVRWSMSRGTLWIKGEKVSASKLLDLKTTNSVDAVDSFGRIRTYSLQIVESPIPSIFITTTGGAPILTKTDWVEGDIVITGGTLPWAKALPKAALKIRGRGNSTWGMAKKPYRFTLAAAAPVLGLTASKKWVLLANYADKSLMRNFVAFNTAKVFSNLRYTPHQYPVSLYLNGEYLGIYGLGEQIETGKGRVDIKKPDETSDTSFLLEINMRIDSEIEGGILGQEFFMTPGGLKLEYKSPDTDEVKPAQKNAIEAAVVNVEKAILARKGYNDLIEVETFIDWLLMEELFKNQDSMFLSSVFLYRNTGGKLAIGPVWDFDLAAGNSDYGAVNNYAVKDHRGWFARYSPWFGALLGAPEFRDALVARWAQVKPALEKEVFASIEEYSALLSGVQRDNFTRWPIMGKYVWPNPPELVTADTHAAQVKALRTWLQNRLTWIDQNIEAIAY